jgi:hypothetical protein
MSPKTVLVPAACWDGGHRLSSIEKTGWTFGEPLGTGDAERAFGLLATAPLSADQASSAKALNSMNLREWPAEDFAAWVRAAQGSKNPNWAGCTRGDHAAYKHDLELWDMLRKRKDWEIDGEVFEQRDCPECKSTLARPKRAS